MTQAMNQVTVREDAHATDAFAMAAGAIARVRLFRVFQYLTFRAVMAAMTALLIGLVAGPKVIRVLTALKIGQPIRGYGMQSHLSKAARPPWAGC